MEMITVKDFSVDVQKAIDLLNKSLQLCVELEEVNVKRDKYIEVSCKSFSISRLGVFSLGIKEVGLTTFSSNINFETNTWWSSWVLNYETFSGGHNCIEVASITYSMDDDKWSIRLERG